MHLTAVNLQLLSKIQKLIILIDRNYHIYIMIFVAYGKRKVPKMRFGLVVRKTNHLKMHYAVSNAQFQKAVQFKKYVNVNFTKTKC